MRQSHIAWGAATIFLAACGGTTEERAATGGLGGAAAGAVVGGPVGAIVVGAAGAAGGAVMDEGVEEKIGEATATAGEATSSRADVLAEIRGWDQFSTFSQAVEATDLEDTLAGDGPFTVFAPTNDAFARLPEGAVDQLMAQENRDQLEALLRHHVVEGQRLASNAIPERIEPMQGGEISATMSGGQPVLSVGEDDNQRARVLGDIPADNGVIHAIDAVLMTEAVRDLLDGQQRG